MKKFCLVLLLWPGCFHASLHAQRTLPPVAAPAPAVPAGGEAAARTAVEAWVAFVDEGQYDKSWDNAAASVKRVVLKDQWVKVFAEHRQRLGKVLSRTFKEAQASTGLPGAPPGQYVTVRYDTVFEHKPTAVETVTCGLDEGGQWRVTGYFVR